MRFDGLPAEAVEEQHDDGVGIRHLGRKPGRGLVAHQRRHQTRDRRSPIVGAHWVHGLRLCRRKAPDGPWTRDHGSVKVSTRGDYAARALLSLALHGEDRPTSVKEIAERTSLPQPYLEQILLAVKGAGLVQSKRGVGGGYVLARPPEQITLAEIMAAVDGPLITLMGEHDHCEGHCILQEVWVCVSDEMRQILEGFTLAELVKRTQVGHPDAPTKAAQAG